MAKCWIGVKKVKKLAAKTGLPVLFAMCRGGTDHRVDLWLEGGAELYYWPKTGEMEPSTRKWVDKRTTDGKAEMDGAECAA